MMSGRTRPRVLQFGTIGQLGLEMIRLAEPGGIDLVPVTLDEADFTAPDSVTRALARAEDIDAAVNAAAYTAVDKAESQEALATTINAHTVGVLARACAARGVPLIHISTEYVFDGNKPTAYTECDPTNPLNAYGRSKLLGEELVRQALAAHVIVRTSWVYSRYGANFVKTMLRLGAERDVLKVVADQYGAPTAAADLAQALIMIVRRICLQDPGGCYGTFHYTGGGETSWFGFAKEICAKAREWAGTDAEIIPISASEYKTTAIRPKNSRLDCSKIRRVYGVEQVPWPVALDRTLDELRSEARTT